MDKSLRYSLLFNYKNFLIYFVHKMETHFLTNTSSNGGVKHLICNPLKHNSQINIMVTFKIASTTYIISQQGKQPRMGQFGHPHF
jgi:hypothetical protein